MSAAPDLDRLLAVLDPDNGAVIRKMIAHLSTRLWTHGTTPGDMVRELVQIQREAAGLVPETAAP